MPESARRSELPTEGWRAADPPEVRAAQGLSEMNGEVPGQETAPDVRRREDICADAAKKISDGEVALDDLLLAARYRYEHQSSYSGDVMGTLLKQYSQNDRVRIEDKYVRPVGVCLLVSTTRWFHRRNSLEIKTYYDGRFVGALQSKFEETLWRRV